MKEIVIDIAPTGRTHALHFDEFPLTFLGKAKVTRASNIVFNEQLQCWDIILPDMDVAYAENMGFQSYEEAREFEVTWLQECKKRGINPYDSEAEDLAGELRF